jgi:hypothetical protein
MRLFNIFFLDKILEEKYKLIVYIFPWPSLLVKVKGFFPIHYNWLKNIEYQKKLHLRLFLNNKWKF